MTDRKDAKRAAVEWMLQNERRLAKVETPAALGKLTEEMNQHLQACGAVPVELPCGCCVLLGLEFRPVASGGFEVRPIRQPAPADVH